MKMKVLRVLLFVAVAGSLFIGARFFGEGRKDQTTEKDKALPAVSFKRDIMPVFRRYCLSCHSEGEANPSEFIADNYETLMKGGKHGPVVAPGMPDSCHLLQKMSPNPPFGDQMPLRAKRPFPQDTLKLLWRWIKEGAKNN